MIDSKGVRGKYQLLEGATEILSIIPWTLEGDIEEDKSKAMALLETVPAVSLPTPPAGHWL